MSKYTINFVFDGLIDIEAKTKKEAMRKYNNLTRSEVIQKSYNRLEKTVVTEVIKGPKEDDKPLTALEKFILNWLGYDETDDEWEREEIEETLPDLESEELAEMIQDIIKNF